MTQVLQGNMTPNGKEAYGRVCIVPSHFLEIKRKEPKHNNAGGSVVLSRQLTNLINGSTAQSPEVCIGENKFFSDDEYFDIEEKMLSDSRAHPNQCIIILVNENQGENNDGVSCTSMLSKLQLKPQVEEPPEIIPNDLDLGSFVVNTQNSPDPDARYKPSKLSSEYSQESSEYDTRSISLEEEIRELGEMEETNTHTEIFSENSQDISIESLIDVEGSIRNTSHFYEKSSSFHGVSVTNDIITISEEDFSEEENALAPSVKPRKTYAIESSPVPESSPDLISLQETGQMDILAQILSNELAKLKANGYGMENEIIFVISESLINWEVELQSGPIAEASTGINEMPISRENIPHPRDTDTVTSVTRGNENGCKKRARIPYEVYKRKKSEWLMSEKGEHMRLHTAVSNKCLVCSKVFSNKDLYYRHVPGCLGAFPKCPVCLEEWPTYSSKTSK